MNIAVASGKGGTGKTLVATNLAFVAAQTYPVTLFDLDVEEPNDHLFLPFAVKSERTIKRMIPIIDDDTCDYCGVCADICEYNALVVLPDQVMVFPDLCHSCYGCLELCPQKAISEGKKEIGLVTVSDENNLRLIAGKLKLGETAVPQLIAETKNTEEVSRINIFDAPPGTSCPVLEALDNVDFAILVTEPTPFGLHDLDLVVQVVRQLHIPYQVVINKSGPGDDLIEAYCQKEQIEIMAKIPESREIAERYARGELIAKEMAGMERIFRSLLQQITSIVEAQV